MLKAKLDCGLVRVQSHILPIYMLLNKSRNICRYENRTHHSGGRAVVSTAENCMRDSKYIRALRNLGHQVIKVPLYLPHF